MKTYILTLLIIGLGTAMSAQEIKEFTFDLAKGNSVKMTLNYANSIEIKAWDKQEVSVKTSLIIEEGVSADIWSLTDEKKGKQLELTSEFNTKGLTKKTNKNYHSSGGKSLHCDDNGCIEAEINYVIYVPQSVALEISSYSGNIEIRGLKSESVYAKSLSGFVDMDWMSSDGAMLELKTITGEVYTDLPIKISNKKKNPIVGYKMVGELNSGGSAIHLESISNDVFFRKKE